MHFLPLFTGIRHLAHVLTVPLTKAYLLCATPAGLDLYIQAMPVGTYRVQSPGFLKIVYYLCDMARSEHVDGMQLPEMVEDTACILHAS